MNKYEIMFIVKAELLSDCINVLNLSKLNKLTNKINELTSSIKELKENYQKLLEDNKDKTFTIEMYESLKQIEEKLDELKAESNENFQELINLYINELGVSAVQLKAQQSFDYLLNQESENNKDNKRKENEKNSDKTTVEKGEKDDKFDYGVFSNPYCLKRKRDDRDGGCFSSKYC